MKISDEYILQEMGGDYIVVPIGEAGEKKRIIIELNESGADVWKLFQEKDRTIDEVVGEMMKIYDGATREEILNDVTALTKKLQENEILDA